MASMIQNIHCALWHVDDVLVSLDWQVWKPGSSYIIVADVWKRGSSWVIAADVFVCVKGHGTVAV